MKRRTEVLGERHIDSLNTQLWLGVTLNKEKKYKEAESVLRSCYEKGKVVLREVHPATIRTKECLETVLQKIGNKSVRCCGE